MIHDAGWPVWLLVITSVLAVALVIERFLSLRERPILPAQLLGQVIELVRQGKDTPEALERLANNSPLGRVLAEVVSVRDEHNAYRRAAVEDVGKDVAHQLNRYIPALATIAVVAPLLGLFGTVVGMIQIFGSYSAAAADPAQLARGISIALYNTGLGIIIAVPALVFHYYFRSRANHFLHQMERQANALDRIVGVRT